MTTTTHHPTEQLPLIDARGGRGFVERLLFGSAERPDQNSRWHQRVVGPQIPGMVSTVTMLFGIWLAMTPFLWNDSGQRLSLFAGWNEILVGLTLAGLGLARLSRPIRLVTATAVGVLLGAWLMFAPFLLNYGFGSNSTPATINDFLVGLTVVAVSVVGYLDARSTAVSSE